MKWWRCISICRMKIIFWYPNFFNWPFYISLIRTHGKWDFHYGGRGECLKLNMTSWFVYCLFRRLFIPQVCPPYFKGMPLSFILHPFGISVLETFYSFISVCFSYRCDITISFLSMMINFAYLLKSWPFVRMCCSTSISLLQHTHTHIYIYIYI